MVVAAAKFTYFIQRGDSGPIKIGKSSCPRQRIRDLATASAEPLRLLAVIDGDHEAELHAKHGEHRMCGEWFVPSAAVLDEVARASADGPVFERALEAEPRWYQREGYALSVAKEAPAKPPPARSTGPGLQPHPVRPLPYGSVAHDVMALVIRNAIAGRRTR